MAIEALKGLSDEQLFNEANADEEEAQEAAAEPAGEPDEEQPAQARDEAGRFAGKSENEPAAPAETDPTARAPADDNAAQVPSWRVREINEEKRALAAELEHLRAERAQWQRRQQAEANPAPQPVKPDPLLDPDGYAKFIREEIRNDLLMERREESLQRAREANQKDFDEAYIAAQRAIDPALKARMQNSRDPGRTLLEWHREQKTRAEVGTDPNAYFDKRLEAYLADPANQAKVVERIRGGIQPAGNGKPGPTSLPPSLTRATNAGSAHIADDDDVSDEGLWRHANA
jgi:hypothetical protein